MRVYIPVFLILATPLWAQQVPRSSDLILSKEELSATLIGNMVTYHTGGEADYHEDGRYAYRYETDGNSVLGTYEFREDGMVCTVFDNGFDRCDLVVKSGDRYVMIVENGERYPIKSIALLQN